MESMRNDFDDRENWERERSLDKNLEREGGYSDRRAIPLNERGAVRAHRERMAGVLQPRVRIGGGR